MGLMASEISVYRWLASWLWAQDVVESYGGRVWWRKAAQDVATRKQRGTPLARYKTYPKGTPAMSHLLQPHTTSLELPPS